MKEIILGDSTMKMLKEITICMIIACFFLGCSSSESSLRLGANPNRYSYVDMPTLTDFNDIPTAIDFNDIPTAIDFNDIPTASEVVNAIMKDKSSPKAALPKSVSQGTGFAVSSEGHIVTAYHILEGKKTIKVYLSKESFVSAKVLYGDPVNDLAVLKVENSTTNFLQVAPMRSAKTGDRVFTIGFPVSSILGREPKYTEGVVSSLSGIEGASSLLQITVSVQPGNSGGALVNENGQVIGIITSTAAILPFIKKSGTLPQNVNWAVKADHLRPLVELPKVTEQLRDREELINHVKKSTFFIETE